MRRVVSFSMLVLSLWITAYVAAQDVQDTPSFPLAESGSHQVGIRTFSFVDIGREREVNLQVWYPAVSSGTMRDADPDFSSAPYPLILSSAKVGDIFGPHLASYGFVVLGVMGQDSHNQWGEWLVDYPLDLLFGLNRAAANTLVGLEGVIDAERTGAMGYSFDGYTSLALSGARIDPEHYQETCAGAEAMEQPPAAWWIDYTCALISEWDEFAAHAGDALTTSSDGLWQPMTDPRIQAVIPMAPEGAWLFGERGLAAANRPVLIIAAADDTINYYDLEAVYMYRHLGTPDSQLISFVGKGHMMVYDPDAVARMKHFATAFFGYYLQGRDNYAAYFSENFVTQHPDLTWGVFSSE